MKRTAPEIKTVSGVCELSTTSDLKYNRYFLYKINLSGDICSSKQHLLRWVLTIQQNWILYTNIFNPELRAVSPKHRTKTWNCRREGSLNRVTEGLKSIYLILLPKTASYYPIETLSNFTVLLELWQNFTNKFKDMVFIQWCKQLWLLFHEFCPS